MKIFLNFLSSKKQSEQSFVSDTIFFGKQGSGSWIKTEISVEQKSGWCGQKNTG